MAYTFDTNAVIYYVKDDSRVVLGVQRILALRELVYVSTITEVELFGYSGLTEEEAEKIELVLQTLSIISLDSYLARKAGTLRRTYNLKTPDSVIAATALFTGSMLVTRNVRDFKKIPELKLHAI